MKKILSIIAIIFLGICLTGCKVKDGKIKGLHHIEIDVKDYGVIKVELNADEAPITVANFIDLAKKGFYDGLTFHRIIDGFMIQGGDPTGTGNGGSDKNIKGEFESNGVSNNIKHLRGVISMARAGSIPDTDETRNSASSQFFICQVDSPHLDGEYAAFGKVTEGMEIVDKIAKDAIVEDNNGTVLPENQPVINSIKVID
jgi:peptidyl-prolyl cis-trans isomerase B (cyclophilin B)